ncbi:MAG: amidohydrolase family protein [Verrucomicrobia bacterium]|nr:amidohydrolase family protein [Verrucomicrobiota bacterium]
MASEKWNESGRVWEEDHGLLDAEQVAQCARADVSEPLRSPIPTRMISNGEYMPVPQTEKQKRVEARIEELSDQASRKLGIDRRRFLRSSGGMAASLFAMNEVFGRFFNVSLTELFEPAAFAAAGPPKDLFVFDDQLHFVRGSRPSPAGLRAIAQGPTSAPSVKSNPFNPKQQLDELGQSWSVWNPALVGLPIDPAYAHITQFIKDVYLDSQVTIGLLSNVTASGVQIEGQRRAPKNAQEAQLGEVLTAGQTAAARNFVNEISGSTRMLCHGLLYVGKGNLEWIQEQIDKHEPDSWKGYNISNAAKVDNDPNSLMRQWRHDDEAVAYPTFELIQKNYEKLQARRPGFNNICVHKGLAPGPPDPLRGHPGDMPKAARDWPKLNFITYHACIQPNFFLADTLEEVKAEKLRGGVPNISWTTEYAQLVQPFPNCYAEIGTTWASSVVTFPTIAAHIMGQLMKFLGEDRIVFGSDSVWYGTPQWQIEALWRFQIPEEMRKRWGYPELTERAKRKILGLTSAKLYGIQALDTGSYKPMPKDYESRMSQELKTILEFGQLRADNMSKMKETYAALAIEPDSTRYGWMRVKA